MTPDTEFKVEVYVLAIEAGGRQTPFVDGDTPLFFFRTTDVTGTTMVLGVVETAMPGDGVKLGSHPGRPVALDDGANFAFREGGQTV
jgi:elongation factor Tu